MCPSSLPAHCVVSCSMCPSSLPAHCVVSCSMCPSSLPAHCVVSCSMCPSLLCSCVCVHAPCVPPCTYNVAAYYILLCMHHVSLLELCVRAILCCTACEVWTSTCVCVHDTWWKTCRLILQFHWPGQLKVCYLQIPVSVGVRQQLLWTAEFLIHYNYLSILFLSYIIQYV